MKICYTIFHIKNEKNINRYNNVKKIHKKFYKNIPLVNTNTHHIFDKKTLNEYNNSFGKFNITKPLKFGEVGCIASNYNAWKDFLKTEYDAILVIEDDAIIQKKFIMNFEKIINELPPTFDLISLYVSPGKQFKYIKEKHDIGLNLICDCYQNQSTLSYLISRKGAEKFINLVDYEIKEPLDLFLYNKSQETEIYSLKPEFDNLFTTNTLDKDGEIIRKFTNIQDTDYIFGGIED